MGEVEVIIIIMTAHLVLVVVVPPAPHPMPPILLSLVDDSDSEPAVSLDPFVQEGDRGATEGRGALVLLTARTLYSSCHELNDVYARQKDEDAAFLSLSFKTLLMGLLPCPAPP